LASAALALVFGVALGNVVRGVPLGVPLDQSGYFFLPFWTNFSPTGEVGIVDWYTLLVGVVSLLALAVHGSLWVTEGSLQERTRLFGARCWTASVPVMLLKTGVSFAVQPNLIKHFRAHPWGAIFPALAVVGMMGARVLSSRRRDLQAFLASGLYLVGMLSSVAFGVFPNLLPSNTRPDLALTIYNAATAEHGLFVGLCWFIPGDGSRDWLCSSGVLPFRWKSQPRLKFQPLCQGKVEMTAFGQNRKLRPEGPSVR
jgi:cytochrome bd ubiquinol oxidase subunit II